MATARNAPEESFDWDQNMDDALIRQLGHVKANTDELEGTHHIMCYESTGFDVGPEHYDPISCRAVGGGESAGVANEMDGDVDDADLIALLTSQDGLFCSYAESEAAKELGGCVSTNHPKVPSKTFPVAGNMEFVYSSLEETSSDEEQDFFLGSGSMNDIAPSSGTTSGAIERLSPPSSLQYPFDDSSQTMEVYDANLRGSTPPEEENSTSDNVVCAGDTRRDVSIASASLGGESDGSMRLADEVTDRTLAITDDELGTIDEGYSDDRDPEPANSNELSLPTDATGDSTSRQKVLGSSESASSSTQPKYKLPPHLLECDASGQPKPFVRPAFPERVQDRSPIIGLSSKTLLRTCFRVGEALRAGSHAVRRSQDAVIELFARVVFSSRDGWKQQFQFADLFHDRPPFLSGTYEIFHGVDLWERNGGRFLTEEGRGKMCRCVGRLKRAGSGWKLVVLNIWEATWDDVAWVKGIVCA
ncbi:hypothetical protein GP486_001118 [Trichoglossum hirsutum]|uniref:Uncharacterized protein n=1 Tax=Trichoglossum hirsutum TaxID=265104 RepID=A0A9P8LHN9_9PEZI|nr:hypothetical protein GP486_001118 [Trichoglossum hirsutum]